MSTKQIHRTISKSKVRSNDGTTISIKAQKGKLQKRVGKKTKKSIIKAKLHKNASYNGRKSKPKTPSSTKNVKINPKKSIIKAKLHKNASYNGRKSKPKTPSSTKNVKINPKKIEKKIREHEFTYWDVLYAHTRKVYQSYYSLMNYYGNLLFQYLYQKPIFSLGV